MAIALLSTARATGTSGTSTVSKGSVVVPAGAAVYVVVACGSSQSVSGVSDGTNTYVAKGTPVTHSVSVIKYSQFLAENCTAGTYTITATISANTDRPWIFVQVVTGQATTSYDTSKTAYQAATTSTSTDGITTGTATISNQPNLVLGLIIGAGSSSPGTGFSFDTFGSDAPIQGTGYSQNWATEYQRTTSTGAKAATWTNGGLSDNIATLMIALDEAVAGSGKAAANYYGMRN